MGEPPPNAHPTVGEEGRPTHREAVAPVRAESRRRQSRRSSYGDDNRPGAAGAAGAAVAASVAAARTAAATATAALMSRASEKAEPLRDVVGSMAMKWRRIER